jgi:hypothetical protein
MADKYREGKLTEKDEGDLEFSIAVHKGPVVLNWGKVVHWIALRPAQARAIAVSLLNAAEGAEQQGKKNETIN